MPATEHFTFDLTGALADQLENRLPELDPEPLTPTRLLEVHDFPGIYQLYWQGDLVYVGKADTSLRSRLSDHQRKISGRNNIEMADVFFTGLYLEGTWIPIGPEQMLIKRLAGEPAWNTNGFGINDPGKERDTTYFRPDHFDVQFPADLDWQIQKIPQGVSTVQSIIQIMKRELPYLFRYEDRYAKHPDYLESALRVTGIPTADELFQALIQALPAGWKITALPGYVVMYKNDTKAYRSARRTYFK